MLLNVRVQRKVDFQALPAVTTAAHAVEERLGDDGRLVLRYSGTEPLARIMIEGPEQAAIDALAEEIAVAIRGSAGRGRSCGALAPICLISAGKGHPEREVEKR